MNQHGPASPSPSFTRSTAPWGANPSQTQGGFIRSATTSDETKTPQQRPPTGDGFLAKSDKSVQKSNTPSNPFDIGSNPDNQPNSVIYSPDSPSAKSESATSGKKPSSSILSRLRFKSPDDEEQPPSADKQNIAPADAKTKSTPSLRGNTALSDSRRPQRSASASASSVETAVGTPAAFRNGMSNLMPGYDQPVASPSQVRVEFQSAREKIMQSLQQSQTGSLDSEIGSMRDSAASMRGRLRNLPIEQRLKIGSISHMYDEAADLIQEGRTAGDQSKVRMGLERIDQATRQLDNLSEQQTH